MSGAAAGRPSDLIAVVKQRLALAKQLNFNGIAMTAAETDAVFSALASAEQRARTLADGFLDYARHRDECHVPPAPCSCGYDDVLNIALGAAPTDGSAP